MQDAAQKRIDKLERELKEQREVTNLLWTGIKAIMRLATAWLAGDTPSFRELLVAIMREGFMKFDLAWTKQKGGSEVLLKLQEELNSEYKRNEILFRFQEKVAGREVAAGLGKAGGGSPARSPKEEGPSR